MRLTSLLLLILFHVASYAQLPKSLKKERWSKGKWELVYEDVLRYKDSTVVGITTMLYSSQSNTWTNFKRYADTINQFGSITESYEMTWSGVNQMWEMDHRWMYTYDQANRPIISHFQRIKNGDWQTKDSTMYKYKNGLLESTITLAPTNYVNRQLYTYGRNDRVSTKTTQRYGNGWQDYTRSHYTYDLFGNYLVDSICLWIPASSKWQPHQHRLMKRDARGNPIQFLYRIWNSEINMYENSTKSSYKLRPNGKVKEYVIERWDIRTQEWVNYEKGTYTFDNVSISTHHQNKTAHIYPNPCTSYFTIENHDRDIEQIHLNNLGGQTLISIGHTEGEVITIPVSDLKEVYILQVKKSTGYEHHKVIVE